MKQFVFSLEKVLGLKKYYEDEAKIELGRAIGVLSELEARIRGIGAELAKAEEAQFSPGNSALVIQQYMRYLLRLENTREQLLKEAAMAELKVEEARNAFLEASRERKVLDKVKEKRQEEYRKMVLAEESKMLDEISSGAPARLKGNHA